MAEEWTEEIEREARTFPEPDRVTPKSWRLLSAALAEHERLRDRIGDLNVELAASKRRIRDLEGAQEVSPVEVEMLKDALESWRARDLERLETIKGLNQRIRDLEAPLSPPEDEPDLDTLARAAHEAYCSAGDIKWGDAPALWRAVAEAVRDALRGAKANDEQPGPDVWREIVQAQQRITRLERALGMVEEEEH